MHAKLSAALALLFLLSACEQLTGSADTLEIVNFEVSPFTVTAGEKTVFLWQVTSEDEAECALDVESDGTTDYQVPCGQGSQGHTYSQPGTFTATLEATLDGEEVSRSLEAYVQAGSFSPDAATKLVWRPSTPQAYGVAEAQGLAVGGKLYSFGGFDSTKRCCTPTSRAYVFEPSSESWSELAPLPPMNGTRFGGVSHAGIATDGRDIFIAGGYTSSTSGRAQIFGTQEVLRYDVSEDSYSRLPDLPTERAAGQLEYFGGKLYYFGGTNKPRTADTGNLYILDLNGGATRWREGAPLPNPRNHLGSAVLGGKIYAIAGQHDHDGNLTTQNDVHAYDPKTNRWSEVAPLPAALSHIADATFVMGDRIVVVGGERDHLKAVDTTFAYDPKADTWTSLTPLPLARMSTVADYLNGTVIVTGGSAETFIGAPVK